MLCLLFVLVIYFDVLIHCYFPDETDREVVNLFPESVLPIGVGKSQWKC